MQPQAHAPSFVKFIRSDSSEELMRHPNCFTLLAQIAQRARREAGAFSLLGLAAGEAMVGDYDALGLTRQEFRTALSNLQKWGFVTTRSTNKGTVAQLCSAAVFDINRPEMAPIGGFAQPVPNQYPTTTQPVPNQPVNQPELSVVDSESATYAVILTVPNQLINHNSTSTQPVPNHELTTKKKEERKKKEEVSDNAHEKKEAFDLFWLAYPRKEARAGAAKAFASLNPDDQAAAAGRVREWFGRRTDWVRNGTDYRPHPTTWLNQKRWTDLTEITIPPLTTETHEHSQPQQPRTAGGFALCNNDKFNASRELLAAIGLRKPGLAGSSAAQFGAGQN